MKISVVVPMYNSESTILRALDSVVAQSDIRSLTEIIVVDDGSTDSSVGKVKDFIVGLKSSVKIKLLTKENGGVSSARNFGIRASSGDWIAFLDSDDAWRRDKIQRQVEVLRCRMEIVFISTGTDSITPRYSHEVEPGLYRVGLRDYLLQSRVPTPSVVVRKDILEEHGLFDETMRYAEDMNLFMKIAYTQGIYVLKSPLVTLDAKSVFGASGLSGNLKDMHEGCLRNITVAKERGYIGPFEALLYRLWERIRYARRVVLTRGTK